MTVTKRALATLALSGAALFIAAPAHADEPGLSAGPPGQTGPSKPLDIPQELGNAPALIHSELGGDGLHLLADQLGH